MFRKKDIDPGPPSDRSEGAKAPPQPELLRRRLELPTGPSAPPQVAPPPQVGAAAAAPRPPSPAAGEDEDAAGKRLIVGRGIRLSGEITACDRLVVEGQVEVTLNETRVLEIGRTGRFIGGCEVEEAEVSGMFEGELSVRGRLLVHASGEITGKVRYGELEIERGGRVSGNVSLFGAPTAANQGSPTGGRSAGAGPGYGQVNLGGDDRAAGAAASD
ncbi:MAG TPA: polymer-forming cytoskeletal protein [Geminicoccaceae bacterium]|nr:polymer-forming cytoskeletal protein [Geminicoccaceae bacterium]